MSKIKGKTIIKNIGKYGMVFLGTMMLLVGVFLITLLIPRETIFKQVEKTVTYYQENEADFYPLIPNRKDTLIDNYADSILYNIMVETDYKHPVEALARGAYYENSSENAITDLREALEKNLEPNYNYTRYWHGMLLFLRPLSIVFSIQEIRIFFAVILLTLFLVMEALLWKEKMRAEVIAAGSAFLLCGFYVVPFCLEYIPCFLVMFFTVICLLRFYQRKREKMWMIFTISGICSAFFDFLTTETLTLLFPLGIYLCMEYRENGLKEAMDTIKKVFTYSLCWGMGYVLVFLSKWGFSWLYLGKKTFAETAVQLGVRVNGRIVGLAFDQHVEAVFQNIQLLLICNGANYLHITIGVLFVLLLVVLILWCRPLEKEQRKICIFLLLLSIIPFIRFVILNNHSVLHSFFTYRALITTLFCLFMFFVFGFKPLKKENTDSPSGNLEKQSDFQ